VAGPIPLSAKAVLQVSPEAVWAFLADTERMNRAIGLAPVRFVPLPDPAKKGHYRAETRFMGLRSEYEEFPFDYVEGRYYRVLRRFESGPFREIDCGIRVAPSGAGSELEVFATILPRGWLGGVVAWRFVARKATEDVISLARALEGHVRAAAPPPGLPPESALHREVLDARLRPLEGNGPAGKLKAHLLEAGDLEVIRMRPYELADRWGEERTATLRLFLHAAKAGVLDLVWAVLCPNCRVAAQRVLTLSELRKQVHCETCGIGFGADFADTVEARFAASPAVREARRETFCIGGPANMPEIVAQLRLEPGGKRREELTLRPGPLRVRCYQSRGIAAVAAGATGGGTLKVRCGEALSVEGGPLRSGAVVLEAENPLGVEALLVLERETWKETAATAAEAATLQEFRDLFPQEAVAPGEEIGISSLAVLFTDLKGSTQLYERMGDGKAFTFVQNHFRYLVEEVARHRGGVVKTMGDAIMATFARGRDAVEAAVAMQRRWRAFCVSQGDPGGTALKVGVHLGPSIAINNAGKLDYFGTTVNTAARVQAQSEGGDVVVSKSLADDPEVRAFMDSVKLGGEPITVRLKGLSGDHTLVRVRP
jgi:class 3 adenylate cyclase